MNAATANLITAALNGAFTLIAAWRRKGMTDAEISARLDAVDAGGDAISVDEVIATEDSWQAAIDEGRAMDGENPPA